MRKAGIIVLLVLVSLVGVPLALLNTSYYQQRLIRFITEDFHQKTGAKIYIEDSDVNLLGNLVLHQVNLKDSLGNTVLKAVRVDVGIRLIPLFRRHLILSSLRLIEADVRLSRKTPDDQLNIQPILRTYFKPKKKSILPWRTDFSSIVCRKCRVRYNVLSEQYTTSGLDKQHLDFSQVSGIFCLKTAPKKHYQITVKKFQGIEKCGLKIDRLRFLARISEQEFSLNDFLLRSASSTVEISDLRAKYHDYSDFSHFYDSVQLEPTVVKATIVPSDFACLKPSLSKIPDSITISAAVQGKPSALYWKRLRMSMEDKLFLDAQFTLKNIPDIRNLYANGQIELLRINPKGMEYLSTFLIKNPSKETPLYQLGAVNYTGHINTVNHKWILTGDFATAAGNISTNVLLYLKDRSLHYEGKISTDDFRLNTLFPEKGPFGNTAFKLTLRGTQSVTLGAFGTVEGMVSHLTYRGYDYQNLQLKGRFDKNGFEGNASINDDHLKLLFSGLMSFSSESPQYKFDLRADRIHFKPLNLSSFVPVTNLSFGMHADFEGLTLDGLLGKIRLDSLSVENEQDAFFLDSLSLVAGTDRDTRHILIRSSLINGELWGVYSFESLGSSLKNLFGRYFPSCFEDNMPTFIGNNHFDFYCRLAPPPASLMNVLKLPLSFSDKFNIIGFYDDRFGKFRIKMDIPQLMYGKTPFRSVGLLVENPRKEAKFIAFAQVGSLKKEMNFNIDLRSLNEKTSLKLNLSNCGSETYSINLQSDIHLFRNTDGHIQVDADMKPSNIIVNDSIWKMNSARLSWERKRLSIENFQLVHSNQYIKIQGIASENPSDTLLVRMNSFSLDDLFTILPKGNICMGGLISGYVFCAHLLKNPAMNADLSVDGYSFNHKTLGTLTARSQWNASLKAVMLNAIIRSEETKQKIATATGAFFTTEDSLHLSIDAERLHIGILEPYLGRILYRSDGLASGNIGIIGPLTRIGIYARMYFENASFGVQMLNTRYFFSDSILVSPRSISFRNVQIKDKEGNIALASGLIRHNRFRNIQPSINISSGKILAMDIPPSFHARFYGTAYCSGTVAIAREERGNIMFDVNVRTEDKSKATIAFLDNTDATEYRFVRFIQKPQWNQEEYSNQVQKVAVQPSPSASSNLIVDLKVEANPNSELTLITDPSTGDEIKARGNGAIRAVISNNTDDIQLFGRYVIENGSYKFIYENLLRRDFTIEKGGSINFSGNPFAAELNIKANYTVNALLSDLLSSEDLNKLALNRSSIPVNCVLKLTGEFQRPDIRLDLAYPSADEDLKRQISNVINTDEMMNQQIVFLMLFGRFNKPNYSSATQTTSNISTALNTTISTLSSQLNNMINDVFGQSKMSFDFDYRNAVNDLGLPGEWKVGMSGQWLNNRLTFNGNLGSRESLTQTNKSQFIGEFDFNLKFKNTEKWSAKFFNRANDNRYFKTALNTQGLGLVYKEDYNKLSDLFKKLGYGIRKPFRKKTIQKENPK